MRRFNASFVLLFMDLSYKGYDQLPKPLSYYKESQHDNKRVSKSGLLEV